MLVSWNDANTDSEPVTLATVTSVHKPYLVHTLGWLLFEDAAGLTLVTEYYEDAFRGRTYIPRAMVESIVQYSLTKKRQKRLTQIQKNVELVVESA